MNVGWVERARSSRTRYPSSSRGHEGDGYRACKCTRSTHPTLRHLDQYFAEPVRHVDHGVVARGKLVDAPGAVRLELVVEAVEWLARIALGSDIGLLRDLVARA